MKRDIDLTRVHNYSDSQLGSDSNGDRHEEYSMDTDSVGTYIFCMTRDVAGWLSAKPMVDYGIPICNNNTRIATHPDALHHVLHTGNFMQQKTAITGNGLQCSILT